jgi:hypothetical protein
MASLPVHCSGSLEGIFPAARDFTTNLYCLVTDMEYFERGKPHYDTYRSRSYLSSSLVPILPSSRKNHKPITCGPDPSKRGLTRCEWESGHSMKPVPGTANIGDAPTDQNYMATRRVLQGRYQEDWCNDSPFPCERQKHSVLQALLR